MRYARDRLFPIVLAIACPAVFALICALTGAPLAGVVYAGVLVLADSRLVSKGYGKKFLNSLPAPHQRIEVRQVGRYLEMWRESHERR